jgi:hypothetical protein
MFKSRHFGQRHFGARHFKGAPTSGDGPEQFGANHFKAGHFSFFRTKKAGVSGVTLVPSSIAIEVLPSSVPRNTPVTIIAYVYDQFNQPMEGVSVSFGSSVPTVLSIPASGATDSLGRVVKTANTFTTGTTNLSATVQGYTAYTTVTVTSAVGGVTSNLTHGATIQPGNAGGGSPGPIKVKLVKRVKRWPTR